MFLWASGACRSRAHSTIRSFSSFAAQPVLMTWAVERTQSLWHRIRVGKCCICISPFRNGLGRVLRAKKQWAYTHQPFVSQCMRIVLPDRALLVARPLSNGRESIELTYASKTAAGRCIRFLMRQCACMSAISLSSVHCSASRFKRVPYPHLGTLANRRWLLKRN